MTSQGEAFDSRLIWIVCAVVLDGSAVLFARLLPEVWIRSKRGPLLGLAGGMMLGVGLFDAIPEAVEHGAPVNQVMIWAGLGFCGFLLVEKILNGQSSKMDHEGHSILAPQILLGDAIHNVGDGVAVSAAFLIDIRLGIVTASSVFLHELPHETADYTVLVNQGYSPNAALVRLTLIQLSAVIGAIGAFFTSRLMSEILPALLAFSAGGFLYISAVKLLPEAFSKSMSSADADRGQWQPVAAFLLGIGLSVGLQFWLRS